MALYLVGYLLPIILAAIAVPMVLGIVPPNQLYGFRTPKTLSSPSVWYPANRIAGWLIIAGSALTICFNLALWSMHPDWPRERLVLWMVGAFTASVLLSAALSLLYLRRL
jgi:uncharacterized membrane protein